MRDVLEWTALRQESEEILCPMSFLDLDQGVLLNVGLLEMGVLVEFDDGWTVDVSEVPDGRLVEIADGTFVWKSGRSGPGHRH